MTQTLEGKVAIVTGAGSGIGRATAVELARRGAAVAAVDRNRTALDETASEITAADGHVRAFDLDVANGPEVAHTVPAIASTFGGLDVLVHAAGIQRYGTAVTTSDEIWDEVMAVNVRSGFLMCRAALPYIVERGGGSVILVGSVQSTAAAANSAAYVTAKHAVLGLVRSVAVDFATQGVRCHCICPAATDTPMLRAAVAAAEEPDVVLKTCEDLHLFKRLCAPVEVARVIAFLASDDASFMTGHPVLVDGGAMVPVGGAAFLEHGTGTHQRA